jgi:hypothetical protein
VQTVTGVSAYLSEFKATVDELRAHAESESGDFEHGLAALRHRLEECNHGRQSQKANPFQQQSMSEGSIDLL